MLSPSEPGEFDHAALPLYFRVQGIQSTHTELAGRGVIFRTAPHKIADLRDRVLWLSEFEDGEDNVFALMAEVPKEVGEERVTAPDAGRVLRRLVAAFVTGDTHDCHEFVSASYLDHQGRDGEPLHGCQREALRRPLAGRRFYS